MASYVRFFGGFVAQTESMELSWPMPGKFSSRVSCKRLILQPGQASPRTDMRARYA